MKYTTARGIELEVIPIPPMQVEMVGQAARKAWAAENGQVPEKPKYSIALPGGGEEWHEHDEVTIEDDPEAAALWKEWQDKTQSLEDAVNEQTMNFLLLKGTKLDVSVDDDWATMQKYFGIDIPEDPIELRLHYLRTEVLSGQDDILGLLTAIMQATGVKEDLVEAARATFQS